MSSSELTLEARKAIRRWALSDFYVYMRPISSKYVDASKKERTYWNVSVEYRTLEFKQWRAEGYDLSSVIMELAEQIPRRPKSNGYQPGKQVGWLAPKVAFEKEKKHHKKLSNLETIVKKRKAKSGKISRK